MGRRAGEGRGREKRSEAAALYPSLWGMPAVGVGRDPIPHLATGQGVNAGGHVRYRRRV